MSIYTNIKNRTFLEAFKNDCKVINLKYEYEGYNDEIIWAIVSDLSEEELTQQYKSLVLLFSPYLHLTKEQYQAIREYNSNEHKHFMRMVCHGDCYAPDDEIFLLFHEDLFAREEIDWSWLHSIIDKLAPVQKRRIVKRFYHQMNNVEIAKEEKVSSQAVDLSINTALKKIEKLIEKEKKERGIAI